MIYRRPTVQTLLLTVVFATMASALMAFSRPIEILVDGQHVESDVPPVQGLSDKIYVPVRSLAEAFGAETSVDGNSIYVIRGRESLRLRVGDVHATFNGMPLTLRHAPFRVRGRVMIGLKAIAQVFKMRTTYDARTARINVITPGVGQVLTQPTPPTQ